MKQRTRRLVAGVIAAAIVAASCGSDEAAPAADTSPPSIAASTDTGAEEPAPDAGVDPAVVRAGELAVVLVDRLGDDETAAGALLLAGDAGYDGRQIEAAVVAGTLAAEGSIFGAEPNLAAYGKVAGFRSAPADEPIPIETLRQEAAERAGREDYWPTGAAATGLILQYQLQGFSQEQIVEMLIFGVEILDGTYEGEIPEGEEECATWVIGGEAEIGDFCDSETGELYGDREDEPATTDALVAEPVDIEASGLCDAFAPPYTGVPIEGVGLMLETEVLGPLETPYYFTEVGGFLDVAADGAVTLTANTVRFADITIRDAPDNQIYIRNFALTGSIDLQTGDGEMTGTVDGTDQLWSGDAQTPISAEASGQLAVVCDEAGGFLIGGFASGNGVLEFEARP